MKHILNQLFEHKSLNKEEAKNVLINIAEGKYNNSQVASFLSVFLMRSLTVEELEGFREAMLELCIQVDLSAYNPIDIVGTGGDGKDTFNISTLACFVVSGAGYKVAKHGNYGVSSISGSSNVMEALGYKFTNDKTIIEKQIDIAGITFLHAPLFHPAMKNVAPIRKELSIKTFFNILGPVVNPCKPNFQLLGVYNLELARLYNYLLQRTAINYAIVYSLDGYDEISLTGPFKIISRDQEKILTPENIQLKKVTKESLTGGKSVEDAAKIFTEILNNKGNESQNNAVIANAAAAINVIKPYLTLTDCIIEASESLKSGKALECFNLLIKNS